MNSVLLVQLTDSHLFAEADGKLLGLSTGDSLARVVELAFAEQPRIDRSWPPVTFRRTARWRPINVSVS